jgi:hypothetical protein
VGRLMNKVTLSRPDSRQSKAVKCWHSTAMAALDQRCTGDCPACPAGLYGRAAPGVALLAKDWAIGFTPRLAGGAAVQTECHLIYQAAH